MENLRQMKAAIAGTILALILTCYVLVSRPFDLTRIRNSFLSETGQPEGLKWRPPDIPPEFIVESQRSPFFGSTSEKIVSAIEEGDWDKALAIARHLTQGPGPGEGISSDTYECSVNLDRRAGTLLRPYASVQRSRRVGGYRSAGWGLSFNGSGGDGHAVNEIYDPRLGKARVGMFFKPLGRV